MFLTAMPQNGGAAEIPAADAARRIWRSPLVPCGLLFLGIFAAAWGGDMLSEEAGNVAAFWPPNALLIAVLLRSNPRRWTLFVVIALVAQAAVDLSEGQSLIRMFGLPAIDMIEVIVGAVLVRRFIGPAVTLADLGQSVRFVSLAGIVAPALGATIAASLLALFTGAAFDAVWRTWWIAHVMGMLIIAPAFLTATGPYFRAAASWARAAEGAAVLVVTAAIAEFAFYQPSFFPLFLAFPVLLWAAYRFGVFGASAAGMAISGIAVWRTISGDGPIAALPGHELADRVLLVQVFLGMTVFSVLAVASMLSERQQAAQVLERRERRFRALIENALDVILLFDGGGRITFASPSLESVLGQKPAAVMGTDLIGLVHPDDLSHARETLARLSVSPGQTHALVLRLRRSDGSWRILESVARNLLDDPGVAAIVLNARDVTERRLVEERIREAQRLEVVGQLTGGIAHDFNNLLTVIQMNLEMILDGVKDNKVLREMLAAALKSARRGAELVAHLVAFARQQVLQPEPTDLNRLVEGTVRLLRRTLGETIEIRAVLSPDLWPAALDRAQMESALINLAVNARDAMERGGRLQVETANIVLGDEARGPNADIRPGPYVMLTATDTGVGMSQAVMERIFEPFFTTKEIGKGSGLGLSMVYGFIKQSGGHIRVTSELGRGTTFRLYFPKAEAAEIKKTKTLAPQVSYQGQGEVVLVVEDDADVRDLAVRYLTTLGYQVIAAIDGPSAKAALRGLARLDFLLTDVVMPKGMSGIDVAKMVESLFPEAKILFMSGYAEDVTGRNTTFDRTVNLIGKPFRKDELARRLRELVTEAA